MKLSDFDYYLPKSLIAQKPCKPRDHSRLLVLDKNNGNIEHKIFYDIVDFFKKGDVLVLNNSKVFPARLIGKKKDSGGKVEVFLHRKMKGKLWQCIVGGRIKKDKQIIEFDLGLEGKILKDNQDGTWEVEFNKSGEKLMEVVQKIGLTPLPPYIKRGDKLQTADKKTYQTWSYSTME